MQTRRYVLLLGIVVFSLIAPGSPSALDYRTNKANNALMAVGRFKLGDEKGFRAALDRSPGIQEVWFDSPGGNVDAAFKIGRLLRSKGIATRITKDALCASACPYAFVGGVIRSVDPGARVGVHMTTLTRNNDLIKDITTLILRNGPDAARYIVAIFEQLSAQGANELARYLMEMRVSLDLMTLAVDTESDEMYYLSRAELKRYNVVND